MPGAHPEEGFHEIQLSGKQLVFLFMATTVVSVVIFLCGVLVGRGVRAEKGEAAPASPDTVAAAAPAPPTDVPAPPAEPAAKPQAADELSYHNRLGGEQPAQEKLKAPAAAPPAETPAPAPAPVVPAPAPPVTAATTPVPAGAAGGYSVQVAALRERGEADSIVKRLTAKGYPAYVVAPAAGEPTAVFRVRVGKYQNRREAEQMSRRLASEEQFKPFVRRFDN